MCDLISVLVPIYNAQMYLDKCLNSIINQTYSNLEIILVDDGSTDNSKEICVNYAKKDSRIKVITQINGGNGSARNTCLKEASGDYFVWVDSDDIIHSRCIEILYNAVISQEADIAVGGYTTIKDDLISVEEEVFDHFERNIQKLDENILYNDEFIKTHIMIFTVPWSKIYKKEVYKNIKYPLWKKHVDTKTTWKTYENAKRVVHIPLPLYFWRINPNSLTHERFDSSHFTILEAYKEQIEFYHIKGKKRHVEIAFEEYLKNFFWCYNRMRENNMEMTPLLLYLQYMRKLLKFLRISKKTKLLQWVKYYYLAYYKIPSLMKA